MHDSGGRALGRPPHLATVAAAAAAVAAQHAHYDVEMVEWGRGAGRAAAAT